MALQVAGYSELELKGKKKGRFCGCCAVSVWNLTMAFGGKPVMYHLIGLLHAASHTRQGSGVKKNLEKRFVMLCRPNNEKKNISTFSNVKRMLNKMQQRHAPYATRVT